MSKIHFDSTKRTNHKYGGTWGVVCGQWGNNKLITKKLNKVTCEKCLRIVRNYGRPSQPPIRIDLTAAHEWALSNGFTKDTTSDWYYSDHMPPVTYEHIKGVYKLVMKVKKGYEE